MKMFNNGKELDIKEGDERKAHKMNAGTVIIAE